MYLLKKKGQMTPTLFEKDSRDAIILCLPKIIHNTYNFIYMKINKFIYRN